MKTAISLYLGGMIFLVTFMSGCATTDDTIGEDILTVPEQDVTEDEEQPQVDPVPEETPTAEEETQEEIEEETDEEVAPVEETVPPDVQPEGEQPGPIEVSEELYDQTFAEVEATISELNEIISDRDFREWQSYLTDDYRRTYSDPDVLEQNSQSTVLTRNNITLRTLEDYFNFVVVPSRSNARLDDLVFLDEETVEAIMEVGERRYLLYLLKKTGNRWKIDTF